MVVELVHHVALEMIQEIDLVLETSWVIIDGVIGAKALYEIAVARGVNLVKVSRTISCHPQSMRHIQRQLTFYQAIGSSWMNR